MAGTEAFREKIGRLGELVGNFETLPGGGSGAAARELVQLLLEVHGVALQRLLEIVFESGPQGGAIIGKVGEDPIVRHLLLLHSLHPEALETRVMKALSSANTKLRKYNSDVELLSMSDGAVQVKVLTTGHSCGSTAGTVKTLIEECMYDQAPDLESLEIVEPEEPSSGFVSIDSLLKQAATGPVNAGQGMEVCGAD